MSKLLVVLIGAVAGAIVLTFIHWTLHATIDLVRKLIERRKGGA